MPKFSCVNRELNVPTWDTVQAGDFVVLHRRGITSSATVEDRTHDGKIIWVRNALNERLLIHIEDCDAVYPGENLQRP